MGIIPCRSMSSPFTVKSNHLWPDAGGLRVCLVALPCPALPCRVRMLGCWVLHTAYVPPELQVLFNAAPITDGV